MTRNLGFAGAVLVLSLTAGSGPAQAFVPQQQITGSVCSLPASYDPNYYYEARDFSPTGNSKYPMIPDHIKACSDLTDYLRHVNGPTMENRAPISTSVKGCSDLRDHLREVQGAPMENRAPISTSIKACSDLTDFLRAKNGQPVQYRQTLSREVVGASTLRDTRPPGHNGLAYQRSTLDRDGIGASSLRDDLFKLRMGMGRPAAGAPDVSMSEVQRDVMFRDFPARGSMEIPQPLPPPPSAPFVAMGEEATVPAQV
jgi:hypothetical protein